ncbi:MAG: recombinase family protein [Clostridiales bacterium]|nr:recombinase family protein [Clostridiales bacterium]
MAKKFGYARVSTNKQDLDAQIEALKAVGVHSSDIYKEEISSRIKKRPKFEEVMNVMEPGDMLVVFKLDRIGRSLKELIDIVEKINEKECNIKTLSGNHVIDTTTAQGKLFFSLLAAFSEYERELIRERTILGLENAKAKGIKLGRKNVLSTSEIEDFGRMLNTNMKVKEICELMGISKSSYYRYKEYAEAVQ